MRRLSFFILMSMLSVGVADAQQYDPRCDINGDGIVDPVDLLRLRRSWHGTGADINEDGIVDCADLFLLGQSWDEAAPTATPTPGELQEITINVPGLPVDAKPLVMVRIPGGSFQMGSVDAGWSSASEGPIHPVDIGYDFYIGKYEVTQGQWTAVTGINLSSFTECGQDCPVESVSWEECQGFIMALNGLGQGTFRLPSEAEWEYACRAGTTTRFAYGQSNCATEECASCDLDGYAWWCGNNNPEGTKAVGLRLPNLFGLYDMHGNVWEWCQDFWHLDYWGAPSDGSAWEAGGGAERVLRGGAWDTGAGHCRSAGRHSSAQDARYPDVGVRVVREQEEEITIDLPGLPVGARPLVMVRIPWGSFQMGSVDPGWSSAYEQPVHPVDIVYDFYMGKYEVTQGQWRAVMGSNPSTHGICGNDCPVESVSWDDCQAFIAALNGLGQGTFRLPSEAEWERACRAGTTTRFSFGDSNCAAGECASCDLDGYAWWCGNNSPEGTKAVGQKLRNTFGLYDMHGSVMEWCQDSWHDGYTGAPWDGSAWEQGGVGRVLRGGAWDSMAVACRSAARSGIGAESRHSQIGLRLVRDGHGATPTRTPTNTPIATPGDTPAQTPTTPPTLTPSDTPSPTPTEPQEITIDLPGLPVGARPLVMVRIPAGSFEMGSVDPGWSSAYEQPVHPVDIVYDFYMGKYEVTQGQWRAVMGSSPSTHGICGNDCPVESVSWDDCQAFIAALNGLGQGTFRLPSEAEWEYACRAGTTTRFSFGDSNCAAVECASCELDGYAWWCGNNSPEGTKAVGQKLRNTFGLYDMHGNVMEWCQDSWHSDYRGAPYDGSAWEEWGVGRVLRGGAWDSMAVACRSAARGGIGPEARYAQIGLRLVRDGHGATPTRTPTNTPIATPGDTPAQTPTTLTPRHTPSPTPTEPQEITVDLPGLPIGARPLVLVRIPAGSFEMGANDPGWSSAYEQPVHPVSIDYDFYLGKYELTQGQWRAVTGSSPSTHGICGNDCPVESVSWDDCQAFIAALNGLGQGTFRLPSEAEWEYACRAGTTTRFSFGDSNCAAGGCASCDLDGYAWWCGNNTPEGTKATGQKLPNALDLHDMHGNVMEWCQDSWHDGYTGAPADGSAWEEGGMGRVLRGGAWDSTAGACRSAARSGIAAESRYSQIGLRLVRDVDSPTVTPSNTPTQTPTRTPTDTPGTPLEEITIDLPNLPEGAQPLVLVRIPAGSFQMGSDDGPDWTFCHEDHGWPCCEQPVRTVNIAHDFYMGKYEITQAQWEAVMGANPSRFTECGPDCPVEMVCWHHCQLFVAALNDQVPGGGFSLPSEAEWEYACRAGTTTRFNYLYFRDTNCAPRGRTSCDLDFYAWWCGNNSPNGTKVVGQKYPNAFGLYDMHGNVGEWCQDRWHDRYDGAPNDGSAWETPGCDMGGLLLGGSSCQHIQIPGSGEMGGVVRGGSYFEDAGACRSAARRGIAAERRYAQIGLRVVRNGHGVAPTASPTPVPFEFTVSLPDLPADAQPLVMVRIPAGSFQMGSDDPGWSFGEDLPVHTVDIQHDFYLGKYEITQAQWEAVMGANPSRFTECGPDCPVEQVSWEDCQLFVSALNVLVPGCGFRMPSEAEWEYACRAGTTTRFYYGESSCASDECTSCDLDSYAWWCGNNAPLGTKVVGQRLANPFGLFDMHGNVREWCEDDGHDSYDGAPANGDPWVDSPRGPSRVLRGGHWTTAAYECRSAWRALRDPTFTQIAGGFRVASSPPEITISLPNLPEGAKPLVMVRVPQGSFQMGSVDPGWSSDCEQPVHPVDIGCDFYMGKYEVTQGQWLAVMGSNPSHFSSCGNDCPVESVSWDDCQALISALNGLGEGVFRLPSEAEWEYACRAGTTTRFCHGESSCSTGGCASCDLDRYGWWCGNNSPDGTKAVGQKLPNAFGLYDMHGNVWEWCQDFWHSDYSGAPSNGTAWMAGGGAERVLRGGAWGTGAGSCRSASRNHTTPDGHNVEVGLRLVLMKEITVKLPNLAEGAKPLVMVPIPRGSFQMGSDDPGWSDPDELPVHTVNIGYDFYMAKYEITEPQWKAVMHYDPVPSSGDWPTTMVSWYDCQAFVAALNDQVFGGGFSLPSEAEWEYACRAGTTTRFYFGDSDCDPFAHDTCELDNYAWWYANSWNFDPMPVGQKPPNPFGLYDMHGNAMEWCQDGWHNCYDGAPNDGSAWEAPGLTMRAVARGGGTYYPAYCRSAARGSGMPTSRGSKLGLRLVRYGHVPSPTPVPPEITIGLPNLPACAKPLVMVPIPAGSFQMGSDDPGWGWSATAELPVHTVDVGYDFYLGKYEITEAQWEAVMGYNPESIGGSSGGDWPKDWVFWDDCQAFIAGLNGLGQGTFRLPSEAEWEYACRAGTTTRFYYGESLWETAGVCTCYYELSEYAWWCGNTLAILNYGPETVGQKLPNAFGLYDMHGNVSEWCEDDWHDSYDGAPANGDAWVDTPRGEYRVLRGGSWVSLNNDCRSSARAMVEVTGAPGTVRNVGFRVVMIP